MFVKYKVHLLLHLIIFIWGFTGIIGKLLHQQAFIIVWYRLLIAFSALGVYMLIKHSKFKFTREQFVKTCLVGMVVAVHWMAFYKTIEISTASLAILCLATTTIHVSWLEPLILKTRFKWRNLLMSILVVVGIGLVAKDLNATELWAVGLGLFAALCAAIFSVSNAKLSQEIPSVSLSFYELLIGFIGLTIYLVASNTRISEFTLGLTDVFWLLFLGIVCTSFAFLATIEIVKKLGAFTVSLSINLEPVYTILLAIVILKEHELLSAGFYIGASIIVSVLIVNGLLSYREKKLQNI